MYNNNSVQGSFIGNAGVLAGNPLTDPRFKIPGTRSGGQPVLPGENKKDIEDVYGRPGIKQMPGFSPFQLPSAMDGIGNMGGMIAQVDPRAAALGGAMRMQPGGAPPGMGEAPNVFSVRPRINYMDPEQGGLELGGAVNIPIGQRGRINVQGGYQPDTTQLNVNATVGQPQGAPGFGVDFFMNRKLRKPSSSPSMNDYGVMGRYGAEF
jgi:hypothetical protein